MGLDASVSVVVGVPVIREVRRGKQTKYDPDTGQPLQVATERHVYVIEGTDTELDVDVDDGGSGVWLHGVDAEPDTPKFYGVRLLKTGSLQDGPGSAWRRLAQPAVDEAKKRVSSWLRERYGYVGSVEMYVLLEVSY